MTTQMIGLGHGHYSPGMLCIAGLQTAPCTAMYTNTCWIMILSANTWLSGPRARWSSAGETITTNMNPAGMRFGKVLTQIDLVTGSNLLFGRLINHWKMKQVTAPRNLWNVWKGRLKTVLHRDRQFTILFLVQVLLWLLLRWQVGNASDWNSNQSSVMWLLHAGATLRERILWR